MRSHQIIVASAVLCLSLSEPLVPPQNAKNLPEQNDNHWYTPSRYNPMKLFKRPKSADEQLSTDADLEAKLTTQLRAKGQLPPSTQLRDACSMFRDLTLCVASLRLSRNLKIDFPCLKWDVTGIKPSSVPEICAGPAGGKAMRLDRAIDLLKPDADARSEANDALREARNEIKDASS